MFIVGAAGADVDAVFDAVESAAAARLPFVLISDGVQFTAVVAECGETFGAVAAPAMQFIGAEAA